MPYSANIKALSLRTLNLIMLALSLLLFGAILFTTFLIWKEYKNFVTVINNYVIWERAAHQVHIGSDYLTEQARLFTQTGQKKYADNYFYQLHTTRSRDNASEFLARNNLEPEQDNNLESALSLSQMLTTIEIYAIRLAAEANHSDLSTYPPEVRQIQLNKSDQRLSPEEKSNRSKNVLFGQTYVDAKNDIMNLLNEVLNENLSRTNLEQRVQGAKLNTLLSHQRVLLATLCILNILTFTMIIMLIVKPLQHYLRAIRDDRMLKVDGAYELRHLALTYNNIFAIKERHDMILKYKAEHDPLTGLLNRSVFEKLETILADEPAPVALILTDVDNFKSINDNFGHEAGDEALKKVANLLKHSFRSDDLTIRMGGDEFAVVVVGEMPDFKKVILEKINYINSTLLKPADGFPKISISAGVAISAAGFTGMLYKQADIALYRVKEGGRNGCQFYDGEKKACL